MDKKNINTIITGVGILLGVGGLYFIGRKVLKKAQEKAEKERADKLREELENIEGSEDMQKMEQAEAKAYNPDADAVWIRNAINGINYNNSDAEELNNTLMKLSNLKLKKIARHYNSKFGISLWQDLDDEYNTCRNGIGDWLTLGIDCYTSSKNRLSRLGFK